MIRDYSVYEFSDREKLIYYTGGYLCISFTVYLFYHSIVIACPAGLLAYFAMPYIKGYLAGKRLDALRMQFKDMLYSLSASVASGRQMEEALIEAGENLSVIYSEDEPIMRELRHMRISIVENRESDRILLSDFASRSKNEDIEDFVQVYAICRDMGGDLEKVIAHTTEILTDKMNIEREIRAITAQKRTEGLMISLMPIAMLLMMNIFSYTYIEPLYTTAAGRILMTAALASMAFGMYLMQRISRIEI